MKVRLKQPLFPPAMEPCVAQRSIAARNKYMAKAYSARASRLCSTLPKFLGRSLYEFRKLKIETFIGHAGKMVVHVQIIHRYRLTQDALKKYLQEKFPGSVINVQVNQDG